MTTEKFIVVTPNAEGAMVPLRGTVWAFSMERAQLFETREAAEAALAKAKQFMRAKTFKAARVVYAREYPNAVKGSKRNAKASRP